MWETEHTAGTRLYTLFVPADPAMVSKCSIAIKSDVRVVCQILGGLCRPCGILGGPAPSAPPPPPTPVFRSLFIYSHN